jgi:hypothetical protein
MYIVQCVACIHGLGRRTPFVSASDRRAALRLSFVHQVVFYWAITIIKVSVALLLIRLRPTRGWKIFLYSTITLLVLVVMTQTLFQFTQCRPFSIYWDPRVAFRPGGLKCLPLSAINTVLVANSSIHVITDLVLSFVPITFIRKLQRPRAEKIFLSILMGLGLFASAFSILRTLGLRTFGSRDFFRGNVMPMLWAMLETEVALIAATAPTLRSFMHRCLVRAGRYFYDEESETQIRGKLVELGFLNSGEGSENGMSFIAPRKPSKPDIFVGVEGFGARKKRDEFGDTVVEEKEIVMVAGKDVDKGRDYGEV